MNGLFMKVPAMLVTLLLVGCGSPTSRTGGGVAEPVTLKAAIHYDLIDSLAHDTSSRAVRVVADGQLNTSEDDEGEALRRLDARDADLAVIRAGRLVAEGVGSLTPLQAPLVVLNDAQALAITEDRVADDVMSGLKDRGLVGLGLVPSGLRHPFAYGDQPLRGASDYRGAVINTRIDQGAQTIVEALGGAVDHSVGDLRTALVASGGLQAIETSWLAFGAVDRPAVVTSNVALYERFDVVVVRKAAWDGLSQAQQSDLRDAVAVARGEVLALRGSETSGLDAWCHEAGATSAVASAEDLATLHASLDPITNALAADPAFAPAVARMRQLGQGTTTPEDLSCAGDEAASASWSHLEPRGDQTALDGTWRFDIDADTLQAAGIPADDARGNAGVWEMEVHGGRATVTLPSGETCEWTFTFAGEQVLLDLGTSSACGGMIAGTYRIDGDTVSFIWTDAGDPYVLKLLGLMFAKAVKVQGG